MKKSLLLLATLFIWGQTAFTQQDWFWSNPKPQGNNLLAVQFLNENTGYAVGDFGTIIVTNDGGNTWSSQTSGTSYSLRAIHFLDQNNGYVVGDSGTILKTSDAGSSWLKVSGIPTANFFRAVQFSNINTGYTVGSFGAIYKTTDAGNSWIAESSHTANRLVGVSFPAADTGTVIGFASGGGGTSGNSVILHTTNGGITWTQQDTTSRAATNGIAFIDVNNGIIVGNSRILKTTNGGTSWTHTIIAGTTLNAVSYVNANVLYAVGNNGVVTKSTDGGLNWTPQTSGANSNLLAISFNGENNGVVVGIGGAMYKTVDGGSSWSSLYSSVSSQEFFAVHFVNRNVGTAVGSNHTIARTTDAGATWFLQTNSAIGTLRGVYFIDENNGYAVSDSGTILHTNDGGSTWGILQQLATSQPLYSVYFSDNMLGTIVGGTGLIMRSTDGGATWINQTSGTQNSLSGVFLLSSTNGYAVGAGGTVLHTTDGGSLWSSQTSSSNTTLRSAYFTDDNNGVICGNNGTILHTTNGGANWTSILTNTNNQLRSVRFVDANNGTIVGYTGYVLNTNDGGATCNRQIVPTANNFDAVWFTDANTATAVGALGTIFRKQLNVDPPIAPTLVFPENSSTNQPTRITLQWNNVDNAEKYALEVATDESFNSIVFTIFNISNTSQEVSLLGNTQYFWHVRAKNIAGYGEYSDVWNFKTMFVSAPVAPALSYPSNGENDVPTTLGLRWNISATSIKYHIQGATDESFTTILFEDSSVVDTTKTVDLGSFTSYVWRVRGYNAGGWGEFSSAWKFRTVFVGIPPIPKNVYPPNDTTRLPLNIQLSWNLSQSATSYHLQVATNSNFSGPLIVDDSSRVDTTYLLQGLSVFTQYYWRVNARNVGGISNYSEPWNFTTKFIAPPPTPSLLLPINGDTSQAISLSLSWNVVDGADSYRIQVATDSAFSTLLINDITTSTSRAVGPLSYLTKYYWRVNAKNPGGTSDYSSIWSFTTVIAPPNSPQLVSPQNNSSSVSLNPTLRWRKSFGADTYHVQLSLDQTFATTIVDDSTLTDTLRLVGPLLDSTIYYWRVSAKNIGGASPFSNSRRFRTVPPPPAAPELLSPSNDSTNLSNSVVFTWTSVGTGSLFYDLQLSFDSAFTTIAFEDTNVFNSTRTVNQLVYNSLYYWRVRARNNGGSGAFSSVWHFKTRIAPPSLISPANGATGLSRNTNLVWSISSSATMYHLQVATDSAFTTFFFEDSTLTDTTHIVGPLEPLTQYFWRVSATSNVSSSVWSLPRTFTTSPPLPQQVGLVSPMDSALIHSDSVMFVWLTGQPNVQRYELQIGTDPAFNTIFFSDTTIIDTMKMVHAFQNNSIYFWRVRAHNSGGWGIYSRPRGFAVLTVGVFDEPGVPTEYALRQNFPNPFNPTTTIKYQIPKESFVSIKLYDITGQEILSLVNEVQSTGYKHLQFDASELPSGIYMYRMTAGKYSEMRKMVLLK